MFHSNTETNRKHCGFPVAAECHQVSSDPHSIVLGKVAILKKILWLGTITLLCFLGLSVAALYALLQSRYSADVVNLALHHFTPYSLSTRTATYTPPYQIELGDVEFTTAHNDQPVQVPKVTLWLSPSVLKNGKLAFDSLLIEGANLDLTKVDTQLLRTIHLNQLALKHTDIAAAEWSVRELSLQVTNPVWRDAHQPLPYGDIQLSAQQLYSDGEAIDQLLIDAKYQPQESTLYGLSFNWRGANISGQAEQYESGWSLINVTINQLKLPPSVPAEQLLSTLKHLQLPISHINSLDVLESSFDYAGWRFERLDASLEDITLNHTIWQQQQGYASFDAESVTHAEIQFVSPTAKLGFTPQGVQFDEFDADFKQGRLQLSGLISPSQIALDSLQMTGIKWLENTSDMLEGLRTLSGALREVSVEKLKVSNGQIIQVEQKPFWQLSGLNIEGERLSLLENGRVGLFSGALELSANSASWDSWLTTQAVINLESSQGKMTLSRAFLPLDNGYVEATGEWQRSSLSAPWQFTLHGDGIPLEHSWLQDKLPFSLTGVAEMDVELSGLSGDYSMLAHSLSGSVRGKIRNGMIDAHSANGESTFHRAWPSAQIQFNADRGRISIASHSDNAQLSGQVDLAKPEFATLLFNMNHGCEQLWSAIFEQTNRIKNRCQSPPAQAPAERR